MNPEHHLPIDLNTFAFVEREFVEGPIGPEKILNQCDRDFLYYCLTYYYPEKFNRETNNPRQIREKGIFGNPNVPMWLKSTGIGFLKVPELLRSLDLNLKINGNKINNYFQFILVPLHLILKNLKKHKRN